MGEFGVAVVEEDAESMSWKLQFGLLHEPPGTEEDRGGEGQVEGDGEWGGLEVERCGFGRPHE